MTTTAHATTNDGKLPIQPTLDQKRIIEDISSWIPSRIMECFRDTPDVKVRLACLNALEFDGFDPETVTWTVETIRDLLLVSDVKMASKVFDFYVSQAGYRIDSFVQGIRHEKDGAAWFLKRNSPDIFMAFQRFLQYIAYMGGLHEKLCPLACKTVCHFSLLLADGYHAEWMTPVRGFIMGMLRRIGKPYTESQWSCARQALEFLIRMRRSEVTKSLVADLITLHSTGATEPLVNKDDYDDDALTATLRKAAVVGVLREALRILENEDWSVIEPESA
jgi:hypothetical protein